MAPKQKCSICSKLTVGNPSAFEEESIECEICRRWCHPTCAKIPEDKFKALEAPGVHWFCQNCEAGATNLYLYCSNILSNVDALKVEVNALKKKVDDSEIKLTTTMDAKFSAFKEQLYQAPPVPDWLNHEKLVAYAKRIEDLEKECEKLSRQLQEGKTSESTENIEQQSYVQRISGLENELDNLNTRIQETAERHSENCDIESIKGCFEDLCQAQILVDLKVDAQNQYSRRETLKISNVPEFEGENLRAVMIGIAADCGIRITGDHISVIHRNGRNIRGRSRDIVCKFTIRDIKHDILRNKHKLRRQDGYQYIYLDEHLTPLRAKIVKELRDKGATVHTTDGKIFVTHGDTRRMYDSPEDFLDLPLTRDQFINLGIYPDRI